MKKHPAPLSNSRYLHASVDLIFCGLGLRFLKGNGRFHRDPEGKRSSLFGPAGQLNGPSVRGDQGSCDGQTHSRSLHALSQTAPAIEFVEDKWTVGFVNSMALIHYLHAEACALKFCDHMNSRSGRRIFGGVLD